MWRLSKVLVTLLVSAVFANHSTEFEPERLEAHARHVQVLLAGEAHGPGELMGLVEDRLGGPKYHRSSAETTDGR